MRFFTMSRLGRWWGGGRTCWSWPAGLRSSVWRYAPAGTNIWITEDTSLLVLATWRLSMRLAMCGVGGRAVHWTENTTFKMNCILIFPKYHYLLPARWMAAAGFVLLLACSSWTFSDPQPSPLFSSPAISPASSPIGFLNFDIDTTMNKWHKSHISER